MRACVSTNSLRQVRWYLNISMTISIITNTIITIIIIIITTRPKPAYGRQGLVVSWSQDSDQAGTFWGVLNVLSRASSAQLG